MSRSVFIIVITVAGLACGSSRAPSHTDAGRASGPAPSHTDAGRASGPAPSPGATPREEITHCCDSISIDSQCTGYTAAGIALVGLEMRRAECRDGAGGIFREGPCPTEGLVGQCRIPTPRRGPSDPPLGQLVSYYGRGGSPYTAETAEERSLCVLGNWVRP